MEADDVIILPPNDHGEVQLSDPDNFPDFP